LGLGGDGPKRVRHSSNVPSFAESFVRQDSSRDSSVDAEIVGATTCESGCASPAEERSRYTQLNSRSSGSSRQVVPSPVRRIEPISQPRGVRCHSVQSCRCTGFKRGFGGSFSFIGATTFSDFMFTSGRSILAATSHLLAIFRCTASGRST
jgi:hypothetical protein